MDYLKPKGSYYNTQKKTKRKRKIVLDEANTETQNKKPVHKHEVYGIYVAKDFTQPVNEIEEMYFFE